MIKITIERVTTETYTEVQNFLVKSTPTDKIQHSSGYSDKVLCEEEYQTRDIENERTVEVTLLKQEMNDEDFDLKTVIAAINGLARN